MPARVMIVDDDPDVRLMLTIALRQMPSVELVGDAADGVEAVEKALELAPDLILMDVMMPRADGIHATRAIRSKMPDSIVIGFTATSEEAVDEMLAAGAAAVIQKTALSELLTKMKALSEN